MIDRTGHHHHDLENRVRNLEQRDQQLWQIVWHWATEKWEAEFVVIDGLSQHPKYPTITSWLAAQGIVLPDIR